MEQELPSFDKLLGDPAEWRGSNLIDDWGSEQTVFRCPQCGAIVGDPYLHKAWHLQSQSSATQKGSE